MVGEWQVDILTVVLTAAVYSEHTQGPPSLQDTLLAKILPLFPNTMKRKRKLATSICSSSKVPWQILWLNEAPLLLQLTSQDPEELSSNLKGCPMPGWLSRTARPSMGPSS